MKKKILSAFPQNRKIKIKYMSEASFGACSWYRSVGVLSKLRYLYPNIEIEPLDLKDWHNIADTDIVFFERPGQLHYEQAFNLIKDYGVKIWSDFDDDLFNVPIKPFNPSGNHFGNPKIQAMIQKYCQMSDVVTVSTEQIKLTMGEFCSPIIIPNAFNDYNYKFEYRPAKGKEIFWRGSIFHRFNIRIVREQVLKLAENYPDWAWTFIGEAAGELWSDMKDLSKTKKIKASLIFDAAIVKYLKMLNSLNCSIQIFPLVDNKFNRAKSNCSWIEGTAAGAVMLAPDFAEYRRPGITVYNDIPDFTERLEYLMNNEKARKENYDKSFEYISNNLLLSKVNKSRLDIIKGLI